MVSQQILNIQNVGCISLNILSNHRNSFHGDNKVLRVATTTKYNINNRTCNEVEAVDDFNINNDYCPERNLAVRTFAVRKVIYS